MWESGLSFPPRQSVILGIKPEISPPMEHFPRTVTPEILDTLDAGHPDAIRSRLDLRRLDAFLGGSRWIVRSVLEHRDAAARGIVELGAGEGCLCKTLGARLGGCPVTGLDLAAPAVPLGAGVHWKTGDFFQSLPSLAGGIVVGSLILHHFERMALRDLGAMLGRFRVLLFSEPLRHPVPLLLSRFASPFVGEVTRHDMPASIRAGFRPGELGRLLGLNPTHWNISESSLLTGVLRFKAWRD